MADGHSPTDVERALALLKRYGHNTTSFQILEPELHYWFDGDDACVAYADTGGAWVAAGGPIAPSAREPEVMQRFADAARRAGRRVRFFAVEREDVPEQAELATLHIGEQPFWDPAQWPEVLRTKRSLREQLRRARAKGVTIRQVSTDELADVDGATRRAIDRMIAHWLDARAMAPMGFVVHLDPYHLPAERRFFVAEWQGAVVAILVAVPIYARDGWFFEDVLRDPIAPNGTIELLFDAAMHAVADEGSVHVTFGLAPLAGTRHRWLRSIRDRTRWLYDFEGLRRFKAKLLPTEWHPVYLAFPRHERGVRAIVDTLEAFARGSFLRFGWRTLVHRARAVTALLALLLIPWTALLAVADDAWFPSAAVKWAWVGFDGVVFALLAALVARWRRPLATATALAAATDFSLGLAQVLGWDAWRAHGPLAWLAIGAALAAPLFAAVFLWASRDRPRHYARWTRPA